LAYSVAIQSAERALFEILASSRAPLKYSEDISVSAPSTRGVELLPMVPLLDAVPTEDPFTYNVIVLPLYTPTACVQVPADVDPPLILVAEPAPPVDM